MLKTRVITALMLLTLSTFICFFNNLLIFNIAITILFVIAILESLCLFRIKTFTLLTGFLILICICLLYLKNVLYIQSFLSVCVVLWIAFFIPKLKTGLPRLHTYHNCLLNLSYTITLGGCFISIKNLFQHSPWYLLSVMAIVWIVDISAYFCGTYFGKHKLAPLISPNKSWEGVLGGLFLTLICNVLLIFFQKSNTFIFNVYLKFGFLNSLIYITILVIACVIGDLFESQLKRRIGVKDSSQLLPGHGGILDRIDSMILSVPLAALVSF